MKVNVPCPRCGSTRLVTVRYESDAKHAAEHLCRPCGYEGRRSTATHGEARTRLYQAWKSMMGRCGHHAGASKRTLRKYADKGIAVCEEWRTYAVFAAWAKASGYADDLTLDLRDNALGYSPNNCRWVPLANNCRHTNRLRLSEAVVREIKTQIRAGERLVDISARYALSRGYVSHIKAGRVWSHVP